MARAREHTILMRLHYCMFMATAVYMVVIVN